jgi:hypothetical protein
LAQKKKDEILAVALDENRKLREEIESLKNVLRARNIQIEELKQAFTLQEGTAKDVRLKAHRLLKVSTASRTPSLMPSSACKSVNSPLNHDGYRNLIALKSTLRLSH